jgi:hypothetical protein
MRGISSAWSGRKVYRSSDGGVSFVDAGSIFQNAIIGFADSVLADGSHYTIDTSGSVTIQLRITTQTLSSITEANLLNNSNLCLIGSIANGFELLNFQTATYVAAGKYTLSNFLRGRYGTEWATGTHTNGDMFLLLTGGAGILRVSLAADFIGSELTYRAASFGQSLVDAPQITFTNNAVGLEPYAPVLIKGSRDGSNNLTITWTRRNRITGAWRDYVDVPMSESTESYEIDVYDNGTIVRTINSLTSETASYTAAQQTTDGLTPGDPVHVKVYQLSATVGRGYAGDNTI